MAALVCASLGNLVPKSLETFLPLCSPTLLPGEGIVSHVHGWRGKNPANEKWFQSTLVCSCFWFSWMKTEMLSQKGGFSQSLEGHRQQKCRVCEAQAFWGIAAPAPYSLLGVLWGVSAQHEGLHKPCAGSLLQHSGTAGCVLVRLQIRD